MAELAITLLPAKKLASGQHKVRIALFHKKEACYFITRFKLDSENQLKNGRVVNHPDSQLINKKLTTRVAEYYNIMDELDLESFSCKQLKEYLEKRGKFGTKGLHERSKSYFEDYFGSDQYLISIMGNNILKYEKELHKPGLNDTTFGICKRQAVINFAIREGFVRYDLKSFANNVMADKMKIINNTRKFNYSKHLLIIFLLVDELKLFSLINQLYSILWFILLVLNILIILYLLIYLSHNLRTYTNIKQKVNQLIQLNKLLWISKM